MSRLSDLIRQATSADAQLGADLEREFRALTKRRSFGLVFERHQPEAVELPGRAVRKGDKVRILPERGTTGGCRRLWVVTGFEGRGTDRIAHLVEAVYDETPESATASPTNLVVVAEFRDHIYPGLFETGRVERGGDKPFHSVINAENFHALEMLTYTHRHAIDAIYIDPPYNTGAKDWKYNNDYVAADDDYRHSKWLAMMERRLLVARELLNPADSVLIVTIDEREVHRLALLIEQTFPAANVQMVTIAINHRGVARDREFTRVDEHAFFVFFGAAGPALTHDDMLTDRSSVDVVTEPVRWERLIKGSNNARRIDRPNLFYPVYVDPTKARIAAVGDAIPLAQQRDSIPVPGGLSAVWPIARDGSEKRWQISPATLRRHVQEGSARVGTYDRTNDRWSIQYLNRGQLERIERGEIAVAGTDANGVLELETISRPLRAAMTVWNRPAHNAGYYGSGVVSALVPGRKFPFPKSLYAVEDALRFAVASKPNAIVLDFFAGSGTTAHAVMRLNRQDHGQRQCISVTNNEVSAEEQTRLRRQGLRPGDPDWEALGICDYITKPRITAAITGCTPDGHPVNGDYKFIDEFPMAEGFAENAAFFTLTYEGTLSVIHHRAFAQIAPLLWLRAGSRGRIISEIGDKGWDVSDAYGVLDDLDSAASFVTAVGQTPSARMAFIVTDDDLAFQMVCRDLPKGVRPVQLYESYLRNFEINSGRFA